MMKFPGLVLVLAFSSVALAQDEPANNMDILIEKLKADKKLLVAENMALTEAEANDFWPLYDEYQQDLSGISKQTVSMIERYAENYQQMTNDEARGIIDRYMEIEEEYIKMRKAYLPKFRKVIPDIKIARYYQIENKIDAAVDYELAAMIPLFK